MARKVYTAKDLRNALIVAAPFAIWLGISVHNSGNDDPHEFRRAREANEDRMRRLAPDPAPAVTTSVSTPESPAITSAPETPKAVEETPWQFHEATDSFSNTKSQYATVKSLNTLQFGFPYQGEQHATLRYAACDHRQLFSNVYASFCGAGAILL
jgi:hypothetical protein